jgi:class 3 adenylate cyclase/predicted ATPase
MTDLDRWLGGLGLEQYAAAFAENAIDTGMLAGLTAEDLKEIGVAALGHRKRLLEAIAALRETGGTPAVASPPPAVTATPVGAERRQLTVMFVDLVGSTALSARLDPEEMGAVLRGYQNAVAGEIARFEGHVAKFMGDGVLAYFGWPVAHEDEAERAVRAGLAIVGAVARLSGGGAPLACRVGLATGLVVVGELIGEGAAQEQTVVGETPNLAARLQALAAPGQVVVAEATRRLLGDIFEVAALGRQAIKGLDRSIEAFAVTGERPAASRFTARSGPDLLPIVGRDQELALLVERWKQAQAGEGQLVLLAGEAGIGKSRITAALFEALASEPHLALRYQCSPYHSDSALWPVSQQMGLAAGIDPSEPIEARLDKLEALLGRALDDPAAAAPHLATLLGIDGEARYGPLDLPPQQRRQRTLLALLDQLSGLAARQPVLLVFEDIHWVDPTTLELIELMLDRVASAPVLLLATARPSFTHGFGGHPIVTRLALNRLGREATAAIMTRVTRGKTLPVELVAEIAARTDGVPLYVEEMTKAVLESGALRETDDAWLLDGPLDRLAIPTSLHDSLMARLDRLHPVKEVAQTAAVIGRSFEHRTIAALAGLPEAELAHAMQRLVEAELVFRRGTPPDATYLFKHALVRDAAYESLLKSRRQALHGRLFDLLETTGDTAPEIRAQHAEAAGRLEAALDAWEEAGRAAVARPAFREAIAAFGAAVRLCGALGRDQQWLLREQALQVQLGQALMASDGYQGQATLTAFERALALADAAGEPVLQLPAVYGLWAGRYIGTAGSAHLADRFAALAATQNDSGPQLIGMRAQALERFHAGRLRESLALAERSLALYRPEAHGDLKLRYGHDPAMAAGVYRSWCLWHLGWADQAVAQMDETLARARTVDHANTTGLALCFGVAPMSLWLRRPEQLERAAREALQLAERMSLALWHAWGLSFLGAALFRQGTATGIDEIEAGLVAARQIGAVRFAPLHLSIAAEAYAAAGRHGAAAAAMAQAFGALEASGDRVLASDLHRVRAAVALCIDAGAQDAAETDLERALGIAREQAAHSLELRASRDLARLWAERGERQRALDLLAPVHGWFTEGFAMPDLVEARALLEELR